MPARRCAAGRHAGGRSGIPERAAALSAERPRQGSARDAVSRDGTAGRRGKGHHRYAPRGTRRRSTYTIAARLWTTFGQPGQAQAIRAEARRTFPESRPPASTNN